MSLMRIRIEHETQSPHTPTTVPLKPSLDARPLLVWSCRRRIWRVAGQGGPSRPLSRWRSCSARAGPWGPSAHCPRSGASRTSWRGGPCKRPGYTARTSSHVATTTPKDPRIETNIVPTNSQTNLTRPSILIIDNIKNVMPEIHRSVVAVNGLNILT